MLAGIYVECWLGQFRLQGATSKYRGRKPVAPETQAEALRLAALGLTKANIAQKLGLGEATIYRILAAAKAKSV